MNRSIGYSMVSNILCQLCHNFKWAPWIFRKSPVYPERTPPCDGLPFHKQRGHQCAKALPHISVCQRGSRFPVKQDLHSPCLPGPGAQRDASQGAITWEHPPWQVLLQCHHSLKQYWDCSWWVKKRIYNIRTHINLRSTDCWDLSCFWVTTGSSFCFLLCYLLSEFLRAMPDRQCLFYQRLSNSL